MPEWPTNRVIPVEPSSDTYVPAPLFHGIVPGATLPGDWFHGRIPANIVCGTNSVLDSSFCFKHFFSSLPIGMRIGSNVTLWRTSIAPETNGLIEIGDFCYLANASLACSSRISIGDYVHIAGGVTITDSDFHPISPGARLADSIALSSIGDRRTRPDVSVHPVTIESDVWIGFNATILKGVQIGRGAIIAPGAVVIQNVPAGAYAFGNPARISDKEHDNAPAS